MDYRTHTVRLAGSASGDGQPQQPMDWGERTMVVCGTECGQSAGSGAEVEDRKKGELGEARVNGVVDPG